MTSQIIDERTPVVPCPYGIAYEVLLLLSQRDTRAQVSREMVMESFCQVRSDRDRIQHYQRSILSLERLIAQRDAEIALLKDMLLEQEEALK